MLVWKYLGGGGALDDDRDPEKLGHYFSHIGHITLARRQLALILCIASHITGSSKARIRVKDDDVKI